MVTYQTHDLKLVGSIPAPNILQSFIFKMINSIGRVSRLQRES